MRDSCLELAVRSACRSRAGWLCLGRRTCAGVGSRRLPRISLPCRCPKPSRRLAQVKKIRANPRRTGVPQTYVVPEGAIRCIGIAFNHGLDYQRDCRDQPTSRNPDVIQTGQEIRLFSSGAVVVKSKAAESKSNRKQNNGKPKNNGKQNRKEFSSRISLKSPSCLTPEQAMAEIQKKCRRHRIKPKRWRKWSPSRNLNSEPKPEAVAESAVADESAGVGHCRPMAKVIGEFSESANAKGVDISGKLGQPVGGERRRQGGVQRQRPARLRQAGHHQAQQHLPQRLRAQRTKCW